MAWFPCKTRVQERRRNMAIPLGFLKYFLLIGGIYMFFDEGSFAGLILGLIGLARCIISLSSRKK